MMNAPWKVILAFIGVFVSGAIVGGVFTFRSSGWRPAMVNEQNRLPAQLPPGSRPVVAGPQVVNQSGGETQPVSNPLTPTLMRQLTRQLDLTVEQRADVRPLVNQASEEFQRLRQENLIDAARVTERMYAGVAELLTPEQRSKLETLRLEMQERVQTERRRRAGAAATEAILRLPASGSSVLEVEAGTNP